MSLLMDQPLILLIGLGLLAVNAAGLLLLLFSRAHGQGIAVSRMFREIVGEALGTFTLLFVGILAVSGATLADGSPPTLVQISFAHGLALTVCLAGLGRFGRGCFNPAVTLGLMGSGRLNLASGTAALAGQAIGTVASGGLLYWLFDASVLVTALPAASISPRPAFVLEAVGTAVLVLVVFGTRIDPRGLSTIAPAAIGSAATVGMLALGPLTGGILNPVRYLGPALWAGQFEAWLVYLIGPAIGAIIAAVTMHFVLLASEPTDDADTVPLNENHHPRQAA